MKTQIATNISQSKRILACGVKPETADMCWEPQGSIDNPTWILTTATQLGRTGWGGSKLAWSLSALLALLPKEINDKGLQTTLSINANADSAIWSIDYYDYYMDSRILYQEATNPIEACVRAIIWLLSNGYSLNNIEQ